MIGPLYFVTCLRRAVAGLRPHRDALATQRGTGHAPHLRRPPRACAGQGHRLIAWLPTQHGRGCGTVLKCSVRLEF